VVLPEVAAVLAIAQFGNTVLSFVRKKIKKSKTAPRKPKQTKEQELVTKLLTDPEKALKEIGAEYLVKNRKRIMKGIEKRISDEIDRI